MRQLSKTFVTAFGTGFTGAVAPGPLLLVCAHQTLSAGFAAGMMTVVGHAALELVLVAAMFAGLARVLRNRQGVFRIVKAGAGAVLVLLGLMMVATAPCATFSITEAAREGGMAQPLLLGAAVSIGNPYFSLWWATVGLGLLGAAARLGRAAVGSFYVGHVLSDFVWFGFVAGSLALGRNVILGPTSYRVLLAASGLFMAGFGFYFALRRDKQGPRPGSGITEDEQPHPGA